MDILRVIFFIIFVFELRGQSNDLYIFENRYSSSFAKLNSETSFNLKSIKILAQYMIDPKGEGVVRYNLVDKYLRELYPNSSDFGILCINLEGVLFRKLKDSNFESNTFREAFNEYVKLIKFVKGRVPNIKIGIYGLPFSAYYSSQMEKNDERKLDSLLVNVDVLFPTLYIAYPKIQKGEKFNFQYLKNNLDTVLKYSIRLNKSLVLPFFWYLIHPTNRLYGLQIIPKEELFSYLNYIYNYRLNGKFVDGIVWWDTSTPFNNNRIRHDFLDQSIKIKSPDDAFLYYFSASIPYKNR